MQSTFQVSIIPPAPGETSAPNHESHAAQSMGNTFVHEWRHVDPSTKPGQSTRDWKVVNFVPNTHGTGTVFTQQDSQTLCPSTTKQPLPTYPHTTDTSATFHSQDVHQIASRRGSKAQAIGQRAPIATSSKLPRQPPSTTPIHIPNPTPKRRTKRPRSESASPPPETELDLSSEGSDSCEEVVQGSSWPWRKVDWGACTTGSGAVVALSEVRRKQRRPRKEMASESGKRASSSAKQDPRSLKTKKKTDERWRVITAQKKKRRKLPPPKMHAVEIPIVELTQPYIPQGAPSPTSEPVAEVPPSGGTKKFFDIVLNPVTAH